jgi:hypothetical protein
LHAIEQRLRRLRSIEIVEVLCAPRLELRALPTRRKMFLEYRHGAPQLRAAEQIDVAITTSVRVWAEDLSTELSLHLLERLEVSPMHADLERGLLSVAGETPFPDD